MDRRVLLAMVLIMLVLIVDQMLSPRYYRSGRKPAPTTTQAPGGGESLRATGSPSVATGTATAPGTTAPGAGTPGAGAPGMTLSSGAVLSPARVPPAPAETREIRTEHYQATFTSEGAAITHWVLDRYQDEVRKSPVDLVLPGTKAFLVVVEAGSRAIDFSNAPFRLIQDDPVSGALAYEAEDSSGVRVRKLYQVGSDRRILNTSVRVSAPPHLGPIRYRIGWGEPLPLTEPSTKKEQLHAATLLGEKLETPARVGPSGERVVQGNVRWVASRSKYFIAAVIPDSGTVTNAVFRAAGSAPLTAWIVGQAAPGAMVERRSRVYAGPIHYETLAQVGAGLEEVANLGWKWMRGISVLMLTCLNLLYRVIPNYGFVIIILAAATKLIFYPLTQSSLRSMKVMHHLQPQIKELQEKYKGDPMKLNQAMMALYKEYKVNPMSGCLPMLLQIPVFIALYNVLLFSIELRASGFVGYIQDLSAPDVLAVVAGFPIHFLPIVMTGSTYLLQAQTPVAPAQKGMMYVMPLFMLFFMYTFPSGVILYWTVNNLLSALQQYLVNLAEDRKMAAEG